MSAASMLFGMRKPPVTAAAAADSKPKVFAPAAVPVAPTTTTTTTTTTTNPVAGARTASGSSDQDDDDPDLFQPTGPKGEHEEFARVQLAKAKALTSPQGLAKMTDASAKVKAGFDSVRACTTSTEALKKVVDEASGAVDVAQDIMRKIQLVQSDLASRWSKINADGEGDDPDGVAFAAVKSECDTLLGTASIRDFVSTAQFLKKDIKVAHKRASDAIASAAAAAAAAAAKKAADEAAAAAKKKADEEAAAAAAAEAAKKKANEEEAAAAAAAKKKAAETAAVDAEKKKPAAAAAGGGARAGADCFNTSPSGPSAAAATTTTTTSSSTTATKPPTAAAADGASNGNKPAPLTAAAVIHIQTPTTAGEFMVSFNQRWEVLETAVIKFIEAEHSRTGQVVAKLEKQLQQQQENQLRMEADFKKRFDDMYDLLHKATDADATATGADSRKRKAAGSDSPVPDAKRTNTRAR